MKENSPSDTAILIARSILLASEDRELRKLVAPGEPEILRKILDAGHGGLWFNIALKHAPARKLLFSAERMLLPGIIAHYLARKRRIEVAVRDALQQGIQQIVILGAGLDTLAARLHREFPETLFFEIDHPATQRIKRRALGAAENFRFAALDLSRDSAIECMRSCPGFLMGNPAAFVVEGLTMYLTMDRVASLMRDLSGIAGPGGRVVFTFMARADDGSIGFRGENPLIGRWLEARREPFLWGISEAELPAFLAAQGFDKPQIINDGHLRAEILEPAGLGKFQLARGECICIASRSPSR